MKDINPWIILAVFAVISIICPWLSDLNFHYCFELMGLIFVGILLISLGVVCFLLLQWVAKNLDD